MQPIEKLPVGAARGLRGIFTDIDDTLTTEGKLSADAYLALWRAKAAGLLVVPVTGRPAGWCDLIARQWPVDGVIGENGALAFYEIDGKLQRLYHPEVADEKTRARLEAVQQDVLREVPGSRIALDQPYRCFDLAFDFAEESPQLGLAHADAVRAVFLRHGAQAKVSSIHVNGWFGAYDKLSMVKLFARQVLGTPLDRDRERYVFCGDSPNDESMFGYFPNACAVANVRPFAEKLAHLPRYVSRQSGGAGFAEIIDTILEKRDQNA